MTPYFIFSLPVYAPGTASWGLSWNGLNRCSLAWEVFFMCFRNATAVWTKQTRMTKQHTRSRTQCYRRSTQIENLFQHSLLCFANDYTKTRTVTRGSADRSVTVLKTEYFLQNWCFFKAHLVVQQVIDEGSAEGHVNRALRPCDVVLKWRLLVSNTSFTSYSNTVF